MISCSHSRTPSLSSFLGFRFLLVHATSFPVLLHSYFSLLVNAGCSVGVTLSCDEDVGEVAENEEEELVDREGQRRV